MADNTNTVFSNVSLTGTLSALSLNASSISAAGSTFFGQLSASSLSIAGQSAFGLASASTATVTSSLVVGAAGTPVTNILKGTMAIVAMSLAASSSVTTSGTAAGVSTADVVTIKGPNALSGLSMHVDIDCFVSAASTLVVRFSNTSTGAVAQIAGTYLWTAFRS